MSSPPTICFCAIPSGYTSPFIAFAFSWLLTLPALAQPATKDTQPAAKNAHAGHQHGTAADVIRSAKSGLWSEAETWTGGKIPGAGAKVLIQTGHRVEYESESPAVIRAINISGTLAFSRTKNTLLAVGLLKIQGGNLYSEEGFDCDAQPEKTAGLKAVLEIGTLANPLPPAHTARIQLTYIEGMDKQSCPALVSCGGRLDLHGAPLDITWSKLATDATAGENQLTLQEDPKGWRVGDRVIVTATSTHGSPKSRSETEEHLIQKIVGKTLHLEKPLAHAHRGSTQFRGEVANLSRNIIVESADPKGERGHTMYHSNSAGGLSYTEFRHLGKKGVLGRYSLHYHLVGDTMRGSSVIGNSIWDSGNRWLTIHGTNYLVVRDNVGYGSVGHGFFMEDGTEVFNVLDRNLAVGARHGNKLPKQVLPFDQNEGAGYWWANSLNTFTRNVAANCDLYGFRFEATPTSVLKLTMPVQQPDGKMKEVDIRTLPFVLFDGNESHSSEGLYGMNLGEGVNRVGPDREHPFIVKNTKIWDTHYAFRPQVPSLLVEKMHLHEFVYGVYHPNYDNHVYRDLTLSNSNAAEPFNRGHDDLSEQYGQLTVDGITFDSVRSGGMPLIQISDHNMTGKAVSHFRHVKVDNWSDGSKSRAIVNLGGGPRPQPKTEQGVTVYVHGWFGPGETAEVVSMRSAEFKTQPDHYKAVADLTGDESRAASIKAVPFPELLQPVDDLPPISVMTHIMKIKGQYMVRGSTTDNGRVRGVMVNHLPTRPTSDNYAQWEIELPGHTREFSVSASDAAGNQESRPHVVTIE